MDTEVKTRWTSGPWTAEEWSCHARTTIKAGDIVIAECGAAGRHSEETLADAQLISKCPELADYVKRQADKGDQEASALYDSLLGGSR